jgi:hypothetical protein
MKRSKMTFAFFLILNSTLFSQKTLAEEALPRPEFSCLERDQKEKIAVCFSQNETCHEALKKSQTTPIQDVWSVLLTATLLGVLGGLVLGPPVAQR